MLAETRAFNDALEAILATQPSVHTLPARGDAPGAARWARRVPATCLRRARAHDLDPGARRRDRAARRRAREPARRLPAHPRRRLDDRLGRRPGSAARGDRAGDRPDGDERRVSARARASVSGGARRLRGRGTVAAREPRGPAGDRRRVGGRASRRAHAAAPPRPARDLAAHVRGGEPRLRPVRPVGHAEPPPVGRSRAPALEPGDGLVRRLLPAGPGPRGASRRRPSRRSTPSCTTCRRRSSRAGRWTRCSTTRSSWRRAGARPATRRRSRSGTRGCTPTRRSRSRSAGARAPSRSRSSAASATGW